MNDYNQCSDFEERLKLAAKNAGNKMDKSISELLYGHHPDLNHKEFAICTIIADTLWDLEGDVLYIEVNARAEAQLSELFENIQEIGGVIKDLVEKGIVKNQTRYFWFGGNSRWVLKSVKVLNLRKDIEAAVFEIISTEFENALKEALAP